MTLPSSSHRERPGSGCPGVVALVGAGLGDPDLLTVRAVRRLETADLVLYDALVDPRVLDLAAHAQRVAVGKRSRRRSGAFRPTSQHTIERLMIDGARAGRRVVRLKCGDPFVLGRGGEEALALYDAGVPFEVVPGVTSAVASATLAGVPLTHRGIASGFVVVSGHTPDAWQPVVDPLTAHSVTIVVLMGLVARAEIATRLLRNGWRPTTPVALVLAAGGPRMRTWRGPLDALGVADHDVVGIDGAPGTLVIGEVVALGTALGAGAPSSVDVERLAVKLGQRMR